MKMKMGRMGERFSKKAKRMKMRSLDGGMQGEWYMTGGNGKVCEG